ALSGGLSPGHERGISHRLRQLWNADLDGHELFLIGVGARSAARSALRVAAGDSVRRGVLCMVCSMEVALSAVSTRRRCSASCSLPSPVAGAAAAARPA